LILLSGLLLIIVYFIARKKCYITFGLHPSLLKKYQRRTKFTIAAAIVLFFALTFSAGTASMPIIWTELVLFIIAIVAIFVGNSPLSIVKHQKGMFWIKGCSNDFLERIRLGSINSSEM